MILSGGETARTCQPAGAVRFATTPTAASTPALVTVVVTVTGLPGAAIGVPPGYGAGVAAPKSTDGGRVCHPGSALTRNIAVPCAGTVAETVPAVCAGLCAHRSRTA